MAIKKYVVYEEMVIVESDVDGMVGMLPVFETREDAEAKFPHARIEEVDLDSLDSLKIH